MLDHIGIAATDIDKSKGFYVKALAPLGIGIVMEFPDAVGLGADHKPFFWLGKADSATPIHVAFATETRASVDAFYKAAMAAGGKDNGGPGLRPDYHVNYYAAFVLDPNGHNIEAVCHTQE